MEYRVLTVNREFCSGGGPIAQIIAERLGWKLLDKEIIDAIAYAAHVEPSAVRPYDERVSSWLRRLNQQAMRSAALAAGLELGDDAVFDAYQTVKISQKIIEEAHTEGNHVIVGRGSQCVLQCRPHVFHVFVYAPLKQRIARLCASAEHYSHEAGINEKSANLEQRVRAVDVERAKYLQQYFGKHWNNPHLYDLMICARGDDEATASAILYAMTGRA